MIDTPEPPPPRPSLSFTVAWTVFALVTFLLVGGTAQMMQLAWGLWFSELVLFAGLTVIGFQLSSLAPLRTMGLHRFDARTFGLGFAFGLVNYIAWAVPLMAAAQAVFPKWMVDQFDSSHVFERASPLELAIVLVAVCVAAPVGEEFLFRGFLQRGLTVHRSAPRAIVVTAFIFSAFHLDPVGLTARFELGVLFGILAWKAGSLWPAIAAHAANNLISSVLFLAAGDAKEEDLVWWVPVVMLIVGNIGMVALVRFARDRLVAEPAPAELPPTTCDRCGVFLEPAGFQLQFGKAYCTACAARPEVALAQNVGRYSLPWLTAGLASLLLLVAVDWRGVKLNLIDAQLQPGRTVSKRDDVKALRSKVRRGEADFQDYERLVRSLK